ncbi:hypothetical protein PMAYCL1PPCAC_19793, partial [Pristionchus mayeri]
IIMQYLFSEYHTLQLCTFMEPFSCLQLFVKCPGKRRRRTSLSESSSHTDDFPSQWFENVQHLVTVQVNAERTLIRNRLPADGIVEALSDHLISSMNFRARMNRESLLIVDDCNVW